MARKPLLLLFILALIIAGCKSKITDFSKIQERNGLFYLMNSDKPFSGKVVSKKQGVLEFEGAFKNGLRIGSWTFYHPNGQKKTSGVYIDGAKDGLWPVWKENGETDYNEVYKYGNLIGGGALEGGKTEEPKVEEEKEVVEKPQEQPTTKKSTIKWVDWEQLMGGSRKTFKGEFYTGGFTQYYPDRTKKLTGYYTNGYRSGKWTYYNKNGSIKDVRYY